jgi:hypothetical protein
MDLEKEVTEIGNTTGDVDFIILGDFTSRIGGLLPGLELQNINNRNAKKTSFIQTVHILSIDFYTYPWICCLLIKTCLIKFDPD